MRPVPAARPVTGRRPFECRVRFHARLRGVSLLSAGEKLPPLAPPPPVQPAAVAPPAPPPPPAPVKDYWETDEGRQLTADRMYIEGVLGSVQTEVADLRDKQASRLAEWQRAAIELAMTIATRLLHERVLSGEFPMESKVRDMIAQLGDDPAVTVRLNPTDLQLLKSRMRGKPLVPDQEDPKFLPDATLGRGECRVEGRESMLLSEVSRELQEIRDELLRSLANARS